MVRCINLQFHLFVAHFASCAPFDSSPGSSNSFKYNFSLLGRLDSIHCLLLPSGIFPSARKHCLCCSRLHKYLWMSFKISDVESSAKKGTDESPSVPSFGGDEVTCQAAGRPFTDLIIFCQLLREQKDKRQVWQQWGLCSRSACRDLPNPSVTAAAHLVNYSYLGPGRGEGPWLLRIRKSREILQAGSGRAQMITHGLFTWTPVLFVLKSSLSWRAVNAGHLISSAGAHCRGAKFTILPQDSQQVFI